MAISGHHKLATVEQYTADADRRKLADSGMRKRTANGSGNPGRTANGNTIENTSE
jgi:hypothetical protein